MASLKIAPHVIEAALNHRSGVIKGVAATTIDTATSTKSAPLSRRGTRHVERIVTGQTGNVVDLATARG